MMTGTPGADGDGTFRMTADDITLSPGLNLLLNRPVNEGTGMVLRFTLRQLEYLVAVGELGSVTEAAERVNVSAPSVSAAISQLEREFGITLFVRRHAHGASPSRRSSNWSSLSWQP